MRLQPDPVIEAYKEGVDVSLLKANLKLSVDQRLRNLQKFLRDADELRTALRQVKVDNEPR